jgi:UDP-N-acetylmuramyl pentapeptide phosphotransferase/UDP-N-acetylglucosamine-1-phosphate transferase
LVFREVQRAMTSIASAAIAFFVSWMALALLHRPGRLPADRPNARSLHRDPVPRGGGVAIWAGVLAGTAWIAQPLPWLAPLLLVVAVSLWDDRSGVPVWLRLAAQVVAALAWVGFPGGAVGTLLMVLAIVWMANLYNFMDGSDGLAAAMTVVGFGAYAVAAVRAGAVDALVSLAIVAATLPFLARNWPPARMFLGDVGAVPLGFMAALLGIAGARAGYWPVWFPVLVFLPFVGDATVTLARRLASGANVLHAHRDHYYQRLVQLGLGHAGTLALYLALMLGAAVSAIAALQRPPAIGATVLALWVVALLLLYAGIGYYWRRNRGVE